MIDFFRIQCYFCLHAMWILLWICSTCTVDVCVLKYMNLPKGAFYGPFWQVSIHKPLWLNWQPLEVAFTCPNLRDDARVHTCMKWMKCTPSKISKQHSRRKTANAHVSIRALYPKDFDDVPCLPNMIYIMKTCGTQGCWTCVKNMSIFQLQLDGITKFIRCDLCHFSVLRQMLAAWALHVSSAIKADVNLEVFWCTPEPTKLTPAPWKKTVVEGHSICLVKLFSRPQTRFFVHP